MMGVAFIQAFRDSRLEILYHTSLDATGTQRFFLIFFKEMEYLNKSQRTMTKDIVYEETVERKGYYQ